MTRVHQDDSTIASVSYAALRYGGVPPASAQAQLNLRPRVAVRLERLFQAREPGGSDPMRPKFARHARHVAAVLAQGGYPALAERRR